MKLKITGDLSDLLNTAVDVIDLESVDPYFMHQIMLNKMLITDKDIHYRVAFEVRKRKEYFDILPFYTIY